VSIEIDEPPPLFSNDRAVCARCGNRREIRMHFDRGCAGAREDHYHRICRCGHEWVERGAAAPVEQLQR